MMYDENGVNRAALSALDIGPALMMYDENGVNRAALSALKDGPSLGMIDEDGNAIWSAP